MPETVDNTAGEMLDDDVPETPRKKFNERTEAKFFEDADRVIAEVANLGAGYKPPQSIAELAHLNAQKLLAVGARTAHLSDLADEESVRNRRQDLYKPLAKEVTAAINYAVSAGASKNDVEALRSISRSLTGTRAGRREANSVSVSNKSYASQADNYTRFIEQYETLNLPETDDKFKVATHRARLQELNDINTAVTNAEAKSNASGAAYDRVTFLDADSLLNSCISSKNYIKSKYKDEPPYKKIANTRFELPTRFRR